MTVTKSSICEYAKEQHSQEKEMSNLLLHLFFVVVGSRCVSVKPVGEAGMFDRFSVVSTDSSPDLFEVPC